MSRISSALQTSQVLLDLYEQTADLRTKCSRPFQRRCLNVAQRDISSPTLQHVHALHKCAQWEYEPTHINLLNTNILTLS